MFRIKQVYRFCVIQIRWIMSFFCHSQVMTCKPVTRTMLPRSQVLNWVACAPLLLCVYRQMLSMRCDSLPLGRAMKCVICGWQQETMSHADNQSCLVGAEDTVSFLVWTLCVYVWCTPMSWMVAYVSCTRYFLPTGVCVSYFGGLGWPQPHRGLSELPGVPPVGLHPFGHRIHLAFPHRHFTLSLYTLPVCL